ncbi:ferredoxin [Mycolicibacterium sp. YH-1]|uniref:ferredoxin n=1 Tax=Mycolicibacterium sp. YH-1 TaxID=2908837 RepID=UPI001F4C02A3|nr:ferredoxin [Mycolicibacterium sp. YH-1]UNB55097.1 ferredoxin [Mycolicibacterium sp. YH-1]
MTVRADIRLDDAPMVPVTCRRCAASVLARKSSWHQTSVQWSAAAYEGCAERREADKLAAHGTRALFLVCSALRTSIADAVSRGELPVVDETAGVDAGSLDCAVPEFVIPD